MVWHAQTKGGADGHPVSRQVSEGIARRVIVIKGGEDHAATEFLFRQFVFQECWRNSARPFCKGFLESCVGSLCEFQKHVEFSGTAEFPRAVSIGKLFAAESVGFAGFSPRIRGVSVVGEVVSKVSEKAGELCGRESRFSLNIGGDLWPWRGCCFGLPFGELGMDDCCVAFRKLRHGGLESLGWHEAETNGKLSELKEYMG